MYLQRQTIATRVFIFALIVLLGISAVAAYGQNSQAQAGSDTTTGAQPVLPADNASSGKDVAKATPLPSADTPPSRVANVRLDTYIIGVGDALEINVWKESELTKSVPVRPDGMISLPLIGELKAVGLTPVQLQDQITAALQKVMSEPQVTVMVLSVSSMTFNIVGQVAKPGYYPLNHPVTVLDAIALSGGFRDFAKQKKIYVLRTGPNGQELRLKFNYKEVIKGKNMAQNIKLEPHDTLVVP
jgi:polysaccharide export outer membrane protein